MKLHNDIKFFSDTIRATSQYLNINPVFVEKDYWITLVLNRLDKSKYVQSTVFKGGTSLSKGYHLISRFSEDVDIAILNESKTSGNKIKTMIRTVEKEMTDELNEIIMEGVTSKGSRYRKSVFEYTSINHKNKNNKLIVEVNSFANPYPFELLTINSMVFDFLFQTNNEKYIKQYSLQPFRLNVLKKEQTLMEKLVSLIRFSYEENMPESISKKIRHFYDLYFLMNDNECIDFTNSNRFIKEFNEILEHDKALFDEPSGWQQKTLDESPLIKDFENIWMLLKDIYITELSALAYSPIPDEKKIAECFTGLINQIK